MTVPGVNLICAASFIAAVGNPNRFMTSRKLVAYLGLDPKVRQSGEGAARSGRISKRGSASARWALVEAAWSAVLQPGPLHAFYERTKARRGHGKAIVATARKLAILFWCMLNRGEDYAHQQPSLTQQEAPAPRDHRGRAEEHAAQRRDLVNQRPDAHRRTRARGPGRGVLPPDGHRPASRRSSTKSGRERDTGARIVRSLKEDKPRGRPGS